MSLSPLAIAVSIVIILLVIVLVILVVYYSIKKRKRKYWELSGRSCDNDIIIYDIIYLGTLKRNDSFQSKPTNE